MGRGEEVDKRFSVHRGIIFRRDSNDEFPVLYVPGNARNLINAILTEMHSSTMSGHLSSTKTLERCQRFFFWPNMRNDIDIFIKACDVCARTKRRTVAQANTPVPFPIPDYPWEVMALDMKTGMTPTSRGHDAFWVMVDKLSRQGHAVPCSKTCTAMAVARMVFDNVVRLHGIPRVIISDRDPRFTGEVWQQLWTIIGTTLNMSTSHHAATDGGSERYIGTLSGMIRAVARNNKEDWDLYLSACEFAYNDSVHPATGFTPFQLANGRDPATPMQLLLHGAIQKPVLYAANAHRIDASAFLQRFVDNLSLAKQHLRANQQRQWNELMHRSTSPIVYEPEDWVYVENPKLIGSYIHTQEDRFLGPYRIVRKVGPNTVELDYGPYSQKHPIMNISKLRPFRDPSTFLPYPTPTEWQPRALPPQRQMPPPALPAPPTSETPSTATPSLDTHALRPPPLPTRAPTLHQRACVSCRGRKIGLARCIAKGHEPEVSQGPPRRQSPHQRAHQPRVVNVIGTRVVPRGTGTDETHEGEVQSSAEGHPWMNILDAVNHGLWPALCRYLDASSSPPSPVFTLIRRTHGDITTNGIVAAFEPNCTDGYPYHIVHEDGDEEDLTESELSIGKQDFRHRALATLFTATHRRPFRMLGLCSGTQSVEKAVKEVYPNAKIITVDINASTSPTHVADITRWDPTQYPPGYFDFTWASPPCTEYSIAKTTGVRNLPLADRIVKACLSAIDYLKPKFWVMENPVGLLRLRPFMQHISGNRTTTTYCHFGFPYRKATDLWTNIPLSLLQLPRCPKQPCEEQRNYGHHTHTAQGGPTATAPGTGSREISYRIPAPLVKRILSAMTRKQE